MAEIEEEKVFQHFLQVPANVRMRMIDKMKTEDRCRMTRCSKSCSREARSSKNHSYQLDLHIYSITSSCIRVTYEKNSITHGYSLLFSGRTGRDRMSYFPLINQHTPAWQIELDDSKEYVQYAIEHFKKMLRDRKNEIKILEVHFFGWNSEKWDNFDFEIESLKNLEILSIYAPIDVQQFLSKIRHPLKKLFVDSKYNTAISANYEQFYHVQSLSWKSVTLDYSQLLQLSANYIEINIGKLTERDIFNFVRSWQNGTLGRDIKFYCWDLTGSNFSRKKLLRLLRVPDQEADYAEIKHFEIPGKSAKVRRLGFAVTFDTLNF